MIPLITRSKGMPICSNTKLIYFQKASLTGLTVHITTIKAKNNICDRALSLFLKLLPINGDIVPKPSRGGIGIRLKMIAVNCRKHRNAYDDQNTGFASTSAIPYLKGIARTANSMMLDNGPAKDVALFHKRLRNRAVLM